MSSFASSVFRYLLRFRLFCFFFFFFQAEDGIRDGHVTGVQTCALPISAYPEAAHREERLYALGDPTRRAIFELLADGAQIGRGRVGKECRSRWSPYH